MAQLNKDQRARGNDDAVTAVVADADRPAIETALGRTASEGDTAPVGSIEAEEVRDKSVGSRPVGDRTDVRLSGTGAIETDDGLDETAEMVRIEAEDLDDDQPLDPKDVPVFDRADHI